MRRIKKIKKKKIIFYLFLLASIILVTVTYCHKITPIKNYKEPFVKIYLHKDASTVDLALETYVTGAVLAEMPLSFGLEALKAQAVCARTYAIYKMLEEHSYPENADLSDDITSCQAFISMEKFQGKNAGISPDLLKRAHEAVSSTRGEVMVYNAQPIDALYHSCCGGRTASAKEGWGKDVPYLQSVKCDACKSSRHYFEELIYTNQKIANCFNVPVKNLRLTVLSRTASGRAAEISVNGEKMTANAFRSRLNLPSTWISFQVRDNKTVITSRGYGHGTGMCQYGANGMAQKGCDYHQILKKYYEGIDFYKIPY